MVTIRTWKLVVAGVVVAWLNAAASAAEITPAPKSDCPKECERRAKAAFAFAKLKDAAKPEAVKPVAPMPKPVTPKINAVICPCGDSCACEAGKCPAGCPAVAAKKPAPVMQYRQVCENGRCYLVPITDTDAQVVPLTSGGCANGQYPTYTPQRRFRLFR